MITSKADVISNSGSGHPLVGLRDGFKSDSLSYNPDPFHLSSLKADIVLVQTSTAFTYMTTIIWTTWRNVKIALAGFEPTTVRRVIFS